MLTELIQVARDHSPMTVGELSARLGIRPGALAPMLDLLIERGILVDGNMNRSVSCAQCHMSCSSGACPFMLSVPATLTMDDPHG